MSQEHTIPCHHCGGEGCEHCALTGLNPRYHQRDIDAMDSYYPPPGPKFWALEREKHGRILRRPEGGEQSHTRSGVVEDHWTAKMLKQRRR